GEILIKLKTASLGKTSARSEKPGVASLDALNKTWGMKRIQPLIRKHPNNDYPNTRITTNDYTNNELKGIFKLSFPENQNLEDIIAAYQQDPNVEYAQLNYIHRIHVTPNDSLFQQQNALRIIQAEQAWDLQLASPDVIVGVIDTGIDYNHDDLTDALWINAGEDLNANGRVDDSDFNGIDDDNNGFIDDIRGWDFTDAPTFPDGGDFENPDNDPFDENGHGTSVAGIIGATGNNEKGIAGLAFGCRIMNLRAGTSLGFLEEDDVASAIVYAVDNGARIINMSFGDEVASPLLRDIMQYAVNQNCVLVASAGNSATDRIHFPSGFPETISVGATSQDDNLAGFSNFGSSVDVVAPGVNILATKRGNGYGGFSGTSASAPFVSALAALVLSKTPELLPESVKGLITSTADDLGATGWDNLFASGRINAFNAVQSPTFSIVRITRPELDQGFSSGAIEIRGTAAGAFLEEFSLELGVGETPANWSVLDRQSNRQIIDEPIMNLSISSLQDTIYTLRLIVQNKDETAIEDKVRFLVDRTVPVITNVRQTAMLDGDQSSFLLEFATDDLCDASVHFRPAGTMAQFQKKELRFRTTTHRIIFTQDFFVGNMEYFIEARNSAGLMAANDNDGQFFAADLNAPPVGGAPIETIGATFQSSFLLEKPADFDQDGSKEIIINEYDDRFNFTALKMLEFEEGQFREIFASDEVLIPRDWGDSDGDGLAEILAGRGASSFILESPGANQHPSQLVWSNLDDTWASRFADLDQDGRGEIILRLDDLFTVWETTGDNAYALVDSFPNPTEGSNFVGVPHSEIGDFDGDGRQEILLGDFDGDVYLYENVSDNVYRFTWSERLPLVDTIDYLSVGDYDGDGI
ncbi:MAG: S8 family serine peptidase, partial [bacterium]